MCGGLDTQKDVAYISRMIYGMEVFFVCKCNLFKSLEFCLLWSERISLRFHLYFHFTMQIILLRKTAVCYSAASRVKPQQVSWSLKCFLLWVGLSTLYCRLYCRFDEAGLAARENPFEEWAFCWGRYAHLSVINGSMLSSTPGHSRPDCKAWLRPQLSSCEQQPTMINESLWQLIFSSAS